MAEVKKLAEHGRLLEKCLLRAGDRLAGSLLRHGILLAAHLGKTGFAACRFYHGNARCFAQGATKSKKSALLSGLLSATGSVRPSRQAEAFAVECADEQFTEEGKHHWLLSAGAREVGSTARPHQDLVTIRKPS